MKIGILTFHCADNYGAVLQAYGLQEYLKSLGHEVYVIDYRPQYLLRPYKIFNWKYLHSRSVVRNLILFMRALLTILVRLVRKKNFDRFRRNHLNLLSVDLLSENSILDAIVFGSDQIWNPAITAGLDSVYFGQFPAAKGKKLIVYAASAGCCEYLNSSASKLRDLISHFQAISVREKSLAEYLRPVAKFPVSVTIDPVLLLGRLHYDKLIDKKLKSKPYLLSFQLCYSEVQSGMAESIATKKGLDMIEVVSWSESLKNHKLLSMETPQSFLCLLQNADYVVTSSFHGTVFAILFEKDFNTISLDDRQSERMGNLLSSLGLSDRLVFNGQNPVTENIDYVSVSTKLSALRIASQTFIKNALN